ncbi:MAG: cobalamin biosynthesis protein [Rhodospirillales bacterium]|nr:cobalamin biosynthesis protein [Rhodospirillales bacterium]
MTALYAGVGCRKNCPADEIVTLVERALEMLGTQELAALATSEGKRGEPVLAAAAKLRMPLHFFGNAALDRLRDRVTAPSARVRAATGLTSVAEAAALAAAGPGAILALPRIQSARATCALARRPA